MSRLRTGNRRAKRLLHYRECGMVWQTYHGMLWDPWRFQRRAGSRQARRAHGWTLALELFA